MKKKKLDIFQDELGPEESLMWNGRPQQGIMLRRSDIFIIPFSLFWAGFACFWTLAATSAGGCFGLFGLPFVAVGLCITVGRFIIDARQRSHTFYGITNERVIIISGGTARRVKSISLKTLSDVTLDLNAHGKGTITFGPEHPLSSYYRGMPWPGMGKYVAPAFEMINDARTAYEQIRHAQNALTSGSTP